MRDTYSKIKSIDDLCGIIAKLKGQEKIVVHCHGVFDLLHPGHLKHFEAAKKKGDVLVVTLTPDEFVNRGPGRPIFNQNLRAETIAAIECVDFVAINEWPTAVKTIKKIKPNFYVKGIDYIKKEEDVTGKIFDEEEAIKSVGGAIYFTDEMTFSSSVLINTFMASYPAETKDFLQQFKKRHSPQSIIDHLKSTEDVKVLVVGDIIIDEYHYCIGMGKSQKDNIIATKFLSQEIFAGGVLAAANHLAGFSKNVTLLSCIGAKNDYSNFIAGSLKPHIQTKLFHCSNSTTVVKRRFVDANFLNKLFEICYLEEANYLPSSLENEICAYLEKHLKDFDMVLVTDFGHGFITPKITNLLCKKAKFLAVNVQTNSANLGFNLITKFPRADYICIDEPEIRLACHDKYSDLEKLILEISKRVECKKIIITRGHRGSLAYDKKDGFIAIPVFSKEVVDRIGAGDAYFSITAPCVYKNNPIEIVGFIGNAVGAMKVLIVGNRSSVEPAPLYKYVTTLLR
jgi:rfaE bifunctional protein nucleotidyltransferase chain/domain